MRKLNWRKDPFYHRYAAQMLRAEHFNVSIPEDFSNAAVNPPCVDQLQEGSCTANAWCYLLGSIAIRAMKLGLITPEEFNKIFKELSRQFFYYCEGALQGCPGEDNGATLTAGNQVAQVFGVCQEATWPYSMGLKKPSPTAYAEALMHIIRQGSPLDGSDPINLQGCIAGGNAFVCGIPIWRSFQTTGADGIVPDPDPSQSCEGGHALYFHSYKHIGGRLYFGGLNSWGSAWANHGNFWISADYMQNYASDHWTVKL